MVSIILSTKPSFAMVRMGIFSVANTIAFGAVATGNMNAHVAAIAAGIINNSGARLDSIAAAASTGISKVAVAVFDVISVRKITDVEIINIVTNNGNTVSWLNDEPIIVESPLAVNAFANTIPPANNNSIPHGIVTAVSHFSKRPPSPFGTKNITMTAPNAIVESPTDIKS